MNMRIAEGAPPHAGLLLKHYESLLKSETAAPEKMVQHQHSLLEELCVHARRTVPAYRTRLAGLFSGGGAFCMDRWGELPVLTRTELEADPDSFRSAEIPENHGKIVSRKTSGTTRSRMSIDRTSMTEIANAGIAYRMHHRHGLDWSRKLAAIRAFESTLTSAGSRFPVHVTWGPAWLSPERLGQRLDRSVFTPASEQLEWLAGLGEAYLNTFPSNVVNLALCVARTQARAPNVGAVLSAGEPATADARRQCKAHIGCGIADMVSSAECGIFATQCPASYAYHVASEIALVEILDDENNACRAGQQGHVTVTTFYNLAMPVIRYRTGDIASFADSCGCSSRLPVVAPLIGRVDQLFFDGRQYFRPDIDAAEMEQYLGQSRWRLQQVGEDAAVFLYSCKRGIERNRRERMAAYVASCLPGGFDVRCKEIGAIGLTPGGKHRSFARCWR